MPPYQRFARSIQTKPITFVASKNEYAGPVLRGLADGKFYMMVTESGGSITLREVVNKYRLENVLEGNSAIDLYKNVGKYAEGEKRFCHDIQVYVTKVGAAWTIPLNDTWVRAIGTSAELSTVAFGASYGSPQVWNVQLNRGHRWYGSHFRAGADWFGEMGNVATEPRVIGTLAQRPAAAAEGVVYYATDTAEHHIWTSSAWAPYVPPA